MEIRLKQYIILPRKLMSTGKAASQAVHAAHIAIDKQKDKKLYNEWTKSGQCVIVLQCKKQTDLMSIAEYCKEWKIPGHLYIDEGLTETDPLTPTAFATGVLSEYKWWPFSKFKLYK